MGAPRGGGPNPEKLGRRVGAQNFALFFLSPTGKFILSSLSGGFLVEFWWCLKRRDAQCARLEFSGCRVKPRRPGLVGPPGFHTTTREPKRAHLSVPVFKNTTKIQREDPRERRNNEISGGREKKERNFGRPRGRAVRRRRVRGRGPKILNTPATHTQTSTTNRHHQQAPPTGTTNRHHQQAPPTGTNRQQATTSNKPGQTTKTMTTTTTENLAKTLKHQNWPNAVWPNAVNTLKH